MAVVVASAIEVTGQHFEGNDIPFAVGVAVFTADKAVCKENFVVNINPDKKDWKTVWKEKGYEMRCLEECWSAPRLDELMKLAHFTCVTDMWAAVRACYSAAYRPGGEVCFVYDTIGHDAAIIANGIIHAGGVAKFLHNKHPWSVKEIDIGSFRDGVFALDPLKATQAARTIVHNHIPANNAQTIGEDFFWIRSVLLKRAVLNGKEND